MIRDSKKKEIELRNINSEFFISNPILSDVLQQI